MDYPLRLTAQLRPHLRSLRKQRGLTQVQLGQQLGLSQVRIAEIEANPGVVSIDQLVRILSALGVTMVLRDQTGQAPVAQPLAKARSATPNRRTTAATQAAPIASKTPFAISSKKGSW